MQTLLKQFKKSFILTSCLYVLFGLVLLFWPAIAGITIRTIFGILLLIHGIVHITGYFLHDAWSDFYRFDLVFGLLAAGLGLFILWKPDFVLGILPFLFGLAILIGGFVNLQQAVDLKRLGFLRWWILLIPSVLTAALGLLLLFHPFEAATALYMLIGAGLILSGISDLCTLFSISRRAKQLQKKCNTIETEGVEIR